MRIPPSKVRRITVLPHYAAAMSGGNSPLIANSKDTVHLYLRLNVGVETFSHQERVLCSPAGKNANLTAAGPKEMQLPNFIGDSM
jgi:hypothetical protein